jgi:hypothetical protein
MFHFFDRIKQIFEAIQFNLINGTKQHSEFSIGKSFTAEPLKVGNRQIAEYGVFIFTERHLHFNKLYKQLGVRKHFEDWGLKGFGDSGYGEKALIFLV